MYVSLLRRYLFPALLLQAFVMTAPAWASDKNIAGCLQALEAGKPKVALKFEINTWQPSMSGDMLPPSLEGKGFAARLCRAELSLIFNVDPVNRALYQGLLEDAQTPGQRMVAHAIAAMVERSLGNIAEKRLNMDAADALAESISNVEPAWQRRYEFYAALDQLRTEGETDFVREVSREFLRDLPRGHYYRFALTEALADRLAATDEVSAVAIRLQAQEECRLPNELPNFACETTVLNLFGSYRRLKMTEKANAALKELEQLAARTQKTSTRANAHGLRALLQLDQQQLDSAISEAQRGLALMPADDRVEGAPVPVLKLNLLIVELLLNQQGSAVASERLLSVARQIAKDASPDEVRLIIAAYSQVFLAQARSGGEQPSLEQWHQLPLAGRDPVLIKVWHDWTQTLLHKRSAPSRTDVLAFASRFEEAGEASMAALLRAEKLGTAPGWTREGLAVANDQCVHALSKEHKGESNEQITLLCECMVHDSSTRWGALLWAVNLQPWVKQAVLQSMNACTAPTS